MDIMSIIGLLGCIGVVIWGVTDSGELVNFIDRAAVAVTFGGTVTALMITFPLKVFLSVPKMIGKVFASKKFNPYAYISKVTEIAHEVRSGGVLPLEERLLEEKDDFWKKGMQCVADLSDEDTLRDMLETEVVFMIERHKLGVSFFEKGAGLAPGFGMIGTLVSLINMLMTIDGDVNSLGPDMGVALLTIFYGSVLANVVFLPIANKLQQRSDEEVLCKQITIEGFVLVINRENPRQIEEKLLSYIPPSMRVRNQYEGAVNQRGKKIKKSEKLNKEN